MVGCDVLYYAPSQAGSRDGWRPCTPPGRSGPTPTTCSASSAPSTAASSSPSTAPAWPTAPPGQRRPDHWHPHQQQMSRFDPAVALVLVKPVC
jgi:hypothetical protein